MIGPNTYNHSLAVNVTVNGSPMLVVRPLNKCSTSPPCMIRTAGQEGSVCLLCLAACQGSKFSPPCRFHGARDSVKGIKDAASWRMATLLLLLGRRGGGLSFCTYGSRNQASVLMYAAAVVIVPAQFTGGCQRGLCHKCDEDTACCDKRSQIQQYQTELMKQAWACVRIQSCVRRRDSVIREDSSSTSSKIKVTPARVMAPLTTKVLCWMSSYRRCEETPTTIKAYMTF